MTLRDLNTLSTDDAVAAFLRCGGSRRWAARMAERRPYANEQALAAAADKEWAALDRADWLEAFAAHPRIGDRKVGGQEGGKAERQEGGKAEAWAAEEQSGAGGASADVRNRLADRNRDYEARFGYIFIVCATGKSASEMLATLEGRLSNDSDRELAIAAEQQRQITHVRLAKLLDS